MSIESPSPMRISFRAINFPRLPSGTWSPTASMLNASIVRGSVGLVELGPGITLYHEAVKHRMPWSFVPAGGIGHA